MHEEHRYIFVPTGFGDESRKHAEMLSDFLETFGLHCVFGEHFGGGDVSEGVRAEIESAWFVIALLTRGVKVDENIWEPRPWPIQEVIWSRACKKQCLLFVEEGVRLSEGILGDIEYITFNSNNFADVLPKLVRQLNSLLSRHYLTIGIKDIPVRLHVPTEPIIDECSDKAKFLILKVRHLAKQQRYEEALQYAINLTEIEPTYWRGWTSLGALVVQLGRLDDGDRVFRETLKKFPNNRKAKATAWHNRAWVEEIKAGCNPSVKSLRCQACRYEKALILDDSRIYTRASLLINYALLGDMERAYALLEESIGFVGFIDALRFELDVGRPRFHDILDALPLWLRRLLYPIRRNGSDGCEY